MKLTGKCKKDFERWYDSLNETNGNAISLDAPFCPSGCTTHMSRDVSNFYHLSNSMRYGVYVDFFYSVGVGVAVHFKPSVSITTGNIFREHRLCIHNIEDGTMVLSPGLNHYTTHNESRTKAIQKANEIYNNQ